MKRYIHFGISHTGQGPDDMSGRLGQGGDDGWSPAVDIFETAEAVTIVAELAGVKREDLKVMVDGNVVRLYGHREATCCEARARFHRLEIASGAFVRSFRINVPFDASKIEARSEDGMLVVRLPKPASPSKQTIAVTSG